MYVGAAPMHALRCVVPGPLCVRQRPVQQSDSTCCNSDVGGDVVLQEKEGKHSGRRSPRRVVVAAPQACVCWVLSVIPAQECDAEKRYSTVSPVAAVTVKGLAHTPPQGLKLRQWKIQETAPDV